MNCPECNVQMERTKKFRCPGCGAEFDRPDDWISVRVRLPEKDGRYLISKSDFDVNSALYFPEYNGWLTFDQELVTHWMPLPEPPKEDE